MREAAGLWGQRVSRTQALQREQVGAQAAVGCRGACHLKSWMIDAEYSAAGASPVSAVGKAAMVVQAENLRAVIDSALVCTFASQAISETWMKALVEAVTGLELDIEACGARIGALERRLAVREGISVRDDLLPVRILEEPLCGGDYGGVRIGPENFTRLRGEYYRLRGWDSEGRPQSRSRNSLCGLNASESGRGKAPAIEDRAVADRQRRRR